MKRVQQPIRRQDVAELSSLFFGSITVLAGTFALWSLTSSLRVTKSFVVTSGLFSNWLVWAAVAAGLHFLGRRVERELLPQRRNEAPVVVLHRAKRAVRTDDATSAAA